MTGQSRHPLPFSRAAFESALRPIEQAGTLPSRFYIDPDIYYLERECLLKRSWFCVAHEDQIPNPGDYLTIEALEEPLLIVRDRERKIRVLSNICRHRAFPIARGSGNQSAFTCQFHGWTYNLDGTLRGAPLMDGIEGFNRQECRLPEFKAEVWQRFIFMKFEDDGQPLGPHLGGIDTILAPYKISTRRYFDAGLNLELDFDWKTSIDIYTESYHTQAVHRSTLEAHLPARLTTVDATDGLPYTVFRNPPPDGGNISSDAYLMTPNFKAFENMGPKEYEATIISTIFPTFNWFVTPDHFFWLKLFPNGPQRNTIGFGVCASEEAAGDPAFEEKFQKYSEGIRKILAEDVFACREAYRGRKSEYFTQGRLSRIEKSTWYFHHWYLTLMMSRVPQLFSE